MPPDDPREWLRLARADLAIARAVIPGTLPELQCFHAQQAAEKAVKAVLVEAAVAFPFVHDLDRLIDLLEEHGSTIPPRIREASELTPYAAQARYPMVREPVTDQELQRAGELAALVVGWAEKQVTGPSA